ncbi:MAG: hypothetical protein GY862_25705 [Gammaproteobacteria bacterium]|nr:hypothetical protein [Gammaproteobacteria bacterium]
MSKVQLNILTKYLVLQSIPGLEDKPVLEFSSDTPYSGLTLLSAALAYLFFVPFQELIFRGGLQTSSGRYFQGVFMSSSRVLHASSKS